MRQKFPAGIGNRRFAFGLSHWWWLAIGQQGSAFWHKLCICDLKYTIPSWHHLGASPSEAAKSGQKQKGERRKIRHLTHNFDTCKKFTWWLMIHFTVFFLALIVAWFLWCEQKTELILLIAKSPHEITERRTPASASEEEEDAAPPTLFVFFLRYYCSSRQRSSSSERAKSCVLLCFSRKLGLDQLFWHSWRATRKIIFYGKQTRLEGRW